MQFLTLKETLLLTLIALGLIIGLISSFFGVGGGFITVPILLSIFKGYPPPFAVGTSLAMISINASLNSWRFRKAGRHPDGKILSVMIAGIFLGSMIGARIGDYISPQLFKWVFLTLLIVSAINTLLKKNSSALDHPTFTKKHYAIGAGAALLAGICSGLIGIGGGIVLIPIFTILLSLPYSWVPTYSNAIVMFGTLSGALTHLLSQSFSYQYQIPWLNSLQVGNVNFGVMALIFCGSLFSSAWGVKLGPKVPPRIHRWLFALMLFTVAGKMLLIN